MDASVASRSRSCSFAANITVAAEDDAGNRTTAVIDRNLNEVASMEITATPAEVVANGQNTVTVSVQALNLLREPVDGARITLSLSGVGSLAEYAVTTSGGGADTVFSPGYQGDDSVVTITAEADGISDSATIDVLGDFPPVPNRK